MFDRICLSTFVASVLTTVSISILMINMFIFSVYCSVLEDCTFLRIYDLLYFCDVYCDFFFISNFMVLSLLPFCVGKSSWSSFQRTSFEFCWCFPLFSSSLSHLPALIFMISFLLLTLDFVLLSLGVRLCCLIFFVFPKIALPYTSLLELLLLYRIGFGSSCFHYHLCVGIFLFPLWFFQWSIGSSVSNCLVSTCLCVCVCVYGFFFLL